MQFFVYSSRFRENRYPIYVITQEDPFRIEDWDSPAYERNFLGKFSLHSEAIQALIQKEPEWENYVLLDDSYLQGESVFVRE